MPSKIPLFGPRHSRRTVLALSGVTSGCLAETSEEKKYSHQYQVLARLFCAQDIRHSPDVEQMR